MKTLAGIIFGLMFFLVGHAATNAGPQNTLTEIIVINDSSLSDLNSDVDNQKRYQVLKFLPHPKNSKYLSIWLCQIKASEEALGGNCKSVSEGEYFEISSLKQLEMLVEIDRKVNYVAKEILVNIAMIPLGIGIFKGLGKAAELIYAGSMGFKSVKWGVFGLTFISEVAINFPVSDFSDRVTETGKIYGMGEHLKNNQAIVSVEDKVNLQDSFKKLHKYLSVKQKMIGTSMLQLKVPSKSCLGCFDLKFEQQMNELIFY